MDSTIALIMVSLAAAPVTAVAGFWRARWAAPVAVVTTALAFAAAIWSWHRPGASIDQDWAPTWGLRIHFEDDGLAALYALMATGIGLAVVLYATRYIPIHLHHQHRAEEDQTRFYAFLLLFMGAMVGMVHAQDLFLIFVFWDLTAIASYFLIGYDHQRREARVSALMALQITGISAIGFLVGSLMLGERYGTLQLPELIQQVEPGGHLTWAAGLMIVAALAKSAQVPLHFWLPRAMAAPTPVSAYLHSAAMVAAGVFLIGRIYPLVAPSETLLDVLKIIGASSILVGGVLALSRDNLKQLLAFSTISQYGYVVLMFGIGGTYGVGAASFYVLAHGICKCALFLTAGAVSEATGAHELSHLGGLWRNYPLLAIASGLSAAALAGLPLTVGWFKDELFFKAAIEHSTAMQGMAMVAAGLTFAYMGRFWLGIFAGSKRGRSRVISRWLVAPVVGLAAVAVAAGIFPDPFVRLAGSAATATMQAPVSVHVAYEVNTEAKMAAIVFTAGTVLVLTSRVWRQIPATVALLGATFGPDRIYTQFINKLNQFSDRVHWIEVRDLRSRVAAVLLPAAILLAFVMLTVNVFDVFEVGSVRWSDGSIVLMLVVIALAAITAAAPRNHFSMVLALSGVGYGLAVVYSLLRAPDVALVAVLIETILSLLIFGFLVLLPRDVDPAEVVPVDDPEKNTPDDHPLRDALLAISAGLFALIVTWGVLSRPAALQSVIADHIALTPEAHGGDVVTVILADFRGFDTAGEITVIGVAFLGAATLLRRRVSR
ncbi:MAG: hydrogen gas-evolving membrane-bound hydrogenase subunit E [Thermomicrobiales bacterium]